jgi:sialate O-acetylesterase
MITPILPYTIKGALWYQGESNVSRASQHLTLFPALIKSWRAKWNQGDFPFLFVQLPNFNEPQKEPSDGGWARFRETQMAALSTPNTGMAVTIDIGEWNDIHPVNKKDVGYRLALAAQTVAYHEKGIVYSGPMYESMQVKGNKIILSFKNAGGGLIAKGDKTLHYFSIAGEDKKFIWAKAEIKKDKVVVWSDGIAKPIAVRYAWADDPEGANLCNKEGLPASPFRTDRD